MHDGAIRALHAERGAVMVIRWQNHILQMMLCAHAHHARRPDGQNIITEHPRLRISPSICVAHGGEHIIEIGLIDRIIIIARV